MEDFVCYTFVIEKKKFNLVHILLKLVRFFQKKNSSLNVAGHFDNPEQKLCILE